MKRVAAIAALALSGLVAPFIPMTASQAAENNVTLVHGIKGIDVDVYVNGNLTVPNFQYKGEVSTTLAAGNYTALVCIHAPNPPATSNDCSYSTVAIAATPLSVAADKSYTVVAGFKAQNAEGIPALIPFVDDVACTKKGEARASLYNAAYGPPVQSVNGFAGSTQFATNVLNTAQGGKDFVAPDADVTIASRTSSNGNTVASDVAQQVAAKNNTITVLTGIGTEGFPYEQIFRRIALTECPVTTSTTAAGGSTTTVQAVSVTPKFTG